MDTPAWDTQFPIDSQRGFEICEIVNFNSFHPSNYSKWVSLVTRATSAPPPVLVVPTTERRESSNLVYRALRLDSGNFAWGSESITRKTRLIQVRYNATNNELLRTQTLVKGAVVDIDATPFRQWYESHYAQPAFRGAKSAVTEEADKKQSNHVKRILEERKKVAKIDPLLEQQFKAGRLLAVISSRPGQSGRADGYILEGKELEFYHHKLQVRKAKHAA
ncbi:hypothetical protein I308_104119 [Cryptococcus tetragattii IND107]|uniref:40S ribosomal protein S8 n=1 Tax=Cryptococcus tetragattii IND107 TaxID=1296105 RepID=A0ABR3BQA7_9TREE